jgi:glycosyltransferase involved in cell wall biosynthesis
MKSKKIIHLITTIERGGAEKQLLILARNQVQIGLEVEIVYLKGAPELKVDFEVAGCTVNDFIANKELIHQVISFLRYIRNSPTPVHAHLPKSELITAIACRKKSFVVTRHNSEKFWPGMPNLFSQILSKCICARASKVISISNSVKNFLQVSGELPKGCEVDVVYYGFDVDDSISSRGLVDLSARADFSLDTFKIGSIGRLVDQKDYPTLFRAFKKLLLKYPNSELYIVGDGNNKSALESLVMELAINNKVHFLGRTQYIFEFLSLIDVFILPSKYEGFGLVLLEAMLSKKPILASNNSSIPEVLGLGFPGLFETSNIEDLWNKIDLIKSDKSFNSILIELYPNQLSKFDPNLMVRNIIRIYDKANF